MVHVDSVYSLAYYRAKNASVADMLTSMDRTSGNGIRLRSAEMNRAPERTTEDV